MRDLLEVNAHIGHKRSFCNPKMFPCIYGKAFNDTHIIDLNVTIPLFRNALRQIEKVSKRGGRILFVGTKMQASEIVEDHANRCGQHYISRRWPGGLLTNWNVISTSIAELKRCEKELSTRQEEYTKKELIRLRHKHSKLYRSFGGVLNMGGLPNLIVVIDVDKEKIAIKEAKKTGIPIVGIVDTNADPDNITYPIPANDDSTKSVSYFCEKMADAVLEGIKDDLEEIKYDNEGDNSKGSSEDRAQQTGSTMPSA